MKIEYIGYAKDNALEKIFTLMFVVTHKGHLYFTKNFELTKQDTIPDSAPVGPGSWWAASSLKSLKYNYLSNVVEVPKGSKLSKILKLL